MKEETQLRLQQLADGCTTEEEVRSAVEALSKEEKMRIVYDSVVSEAHEDVRSWGVAFIDFVDKEGIVNDVENRVSRRAPVLGALVASTKMLEMSSAVQARQELQAQDADTQYGMEIANRIDDYAQVISKNVNDLITLSCHYESILAGRRMGFHFTSDEGEGVLIDRSDSERS